ncbi:MAG: alpha/beta hydrolase family protein [Muribaculaceae bacterium]
MRKILCAVTLILAGCYALALERDVEVVTDTFRLPGTFVLPDGVVGKVPCVVFMHGSGPNDRDETIGPNNVFKGLADSLSAKGIASLRYDKRTLVYRANFVPQGKEANYDFEVIDDAVSAVALARSVPEVDATKVYVVGHSLGAMLAPEIAIRVKDLAGIVMLAAPSEKLPDMMIYQANFLKGIYAEMGASQAVKMA